MAYQKERDMPDPVTETPCVFLRSKAIYVTGEFTPNHDDEEGGNDYCWCNMTQHVLGPDGKDVNQRQCIPGRECFRRTR